MRPVIILLLYSAALLGQAGDSLLGHILSLQNDTQKVNELYKRGFALRNQDPLLAMRYSEECNEIARKSHSPKHLAKSLNLAGILFYKKGDHSKALSLHKQALEIREKINDPQGIALSRINLGNIYSEAGLFDKASDSYLRAINTLKTVNDRKGIANCLINLGVIDQNLHHLDAALENYQLALKIGEELYDYEIKSLCLNNIAQVYFDRGDYQHSIAFNFDALKIRDMMDDRLGAADSYLNLSSNFLKQKEFAKAKEMLDTAYTVSLQYDYAEGRLAAFHIYSEYFSELKEYEKAYSFLRRLQIEKDSLALIENQAGYSLDRAGLIPTPMTENSVPLNNLWLLVSVLVLFISVPLILVRFKR